MTKDNMERCPQERTMSTMKIKTSSFDNKNVLNFKLKHRKAEKSILSQREPITRLLIREIWRPVREIISVSGKLPDNLGELAYIPANNYNL